MADNPNNEFSFLDNAVNNINVKLNPTINDGYGVFKSNPKYNTSEMSAINKDGEINDTWWDNTYNDFWNAYYQTKLSTLEGKAEAGDNMFPMPWTKLEGASAILDNYDTKLAGYDEQYKKGLLTQGEYNSRVSLLNEEKKDAEEKLSSLTSEMKDVKAKMDKYPVNKGFKAKQAYINSEGDAASIWDRSFYNVGNLAGSSASLVGPSMLATFGSKITQKLLTRGLTYAIPGIGEVAGAADILSSAATFGGVVLENVWSRAQETYGEIMGPINEARERMANEYRTKHNLDADAPIPEDEMRKIRIASRTGMEQQFRENMALVGQDVALAALTPFSNVGYGVGKSIRTFMNLGENLAAEAKAFGTLGIVAESVGRKYLEDQGEAFEEGFQYAAEQRAKDAIMTGKAKNDWSSTVDYIMNDGRDVLASMNFIPGLKSNLGGKYSDDAEFQSSAFGGALLGGLMSGPMNAISLGKELMAYKAAKKDLIDAGALDFDTKLQNLNNSILEHYFKTNRIDALATALSFLRKAKKEDGTPLYEPGEIEKVSKDIKEAYQIYENVVSHVENRVGNDRVFGVLDSKSLKEAKDKLRTDIFNSSVAISKKRKELNEVENQYETEFAKHDAIFESKISERASLESELESVKSALKVHNDLLNKTNDSKLIAFKQRHIELLTEKKKGLESKIKDLPQSDKDWAAPFELDELNKKRTALHLNIVDETEKLFKLKNIKTKSDLKEHYDKEPVRQSPQDNTKQTRTQGNSQQGPFESKPAFDFGKPENDLEKSILDIVNTDEVHDKFSNTRTKTEADKKSFYGAISVYKNLLKVDKAKATRENIENYLKTQKIFQNKIVLKKVTDLVYNHIQSQDNLGFSNLFNDLGSSVVNGLYNTIFDKLSKGKPTGERLDTKLHEAYKNGLIRSAEDVKTFLENESSKKAKEPAMSYADMYKSLINNQSLPSEYAGILTPLFDKGLIKSENDVKKAIEATQQPSGDDLFKQDVKQLLDIIKATGDSYKDKGNKMVNKIREIFGMTPEDEMPFTILMEELSNNLIMVDNAVKYFDQIEKAYKAVFNDDNNYILDTSTGTVTIEEVSSPIPPVQSLSWVEDINDSVREALRAKEWAPSSTGLKIISSTSIAQANIKDESVHFIDGKIHGDYRDEQGNIVYSEQDDQQLNNTDFIKPGDTVEVRMDLGMFDYNADAKKQMIERRRTSALENITVNPHNLKKGDIFFNEKGNQFRIESKGMGLHGTKAINVLFGEEYTLDLFKGTLYTANPVNVNKQFDAEHVALSEVAEKGIDISDDSDANYDNAVIGIYKKVSYEINGVEVEKELRLGSLHKLSSLKRLLAQSSEIEEETNRLRSLRKEVIKNGPKNLKIKSKGFGFQNTTKTKVSLRTAFNKDSRVYLTVVDGTGRPILRGGTQGIEIQGKGFIPGSVLVMVPNGDVHVPVFISKNTLSYDNNINDLVFNSISKYLMDGARKHLAAKSGDVYGAEAFVYTSSNNKILANMTSGSGMFVHAVDGVPAVTIGNNTFTAEKADGLREAIGSLYINLNKDLMFGSESKDYINMMFNSHLFTTNLQANPVLTTRYAEGDYAFLKDNDQFSYFSQHTVDLDYSVDENKEGPQVITTEKLDEIDAALADRGLAIDFDDMDFAEDIIPDEEGEKKVPLSIRERMLIAPNINPTLQDEMIDSVGYMLVNQSASSEETNKDAVKRILTENRNIYASKLDKVNEAQKASLEKVIGNYNLLLEHYEEVYKRAKRLLKSLGMKNIDEYSDYYENLEEEGEENGFTGFNEDSNRTRNQKDFLPSDVRKLLYFLPRVTSLDPDKEADAKLIASSGKNYKTVKNSFGLDSFNDFNDTWIKVLNITSSKRFKSSKEGYDAMIVELKRAENPAVIKELVSKLEKAPYQLRNAFFRNVYLQSQKNATIRFTFKHFKEIVNKVKSESTKRISYIMNSDRKTAERRIIDDLYNKFKSNKSGILKEVVNANGLSEYYINSELVDKLVEEINSVYNDTTSFVQRKAYEAGRQIEKPTNEFTPKARMQLYNVLVKAGLTIDYSAYKDLISNTFIPGSKARGQAVVFKSLFTDKFFKTLQGKTLADEKGAPFSKNNPFESDSSVIAAIAKQEYNYKPIRSSGSFRQGGKSYFPFVRHNMMSEMFLDLYHGSKFVENKLKYDAFAKYSRILQMVNDPEEEKFTNALELMYELGTKVPEKDIKLLKEMTPREYTVTRLATFQNQGERTVGFMYDTLSDKTTKLLVKMFKHDVTGFNIADGRIYFSDATYKELSRVFDAEVERINKVQRENIEFNNKENGLTDKIIKNYHDVLDNNGNVKKLGMGKLFNVYYFLNRDFLLSTNPTLASLMYEENGNLKSEIPKEAMTHIKGEIFRHMTNVVIKNKKDFESLGLFEYSVDERSGEVKCDISDLIDHKYLTAKHGVLHNLGFSMSTLSKEDNKRLEEGKYFEVLGPTWINRVINYAVIDYTINSTLFSNEMLMLTGDPAQAGKPAGGDELKSIKENYKDNPAEVAKRTVLAHVISTFINLGKRNASFLASGEKGMFDKADYSVAIANDIAINDKNAAILENYRKRFPDNVSGINKAYGEGDLTDAQEVTTVEEHLHVMKAYGKISEETYRKALYFYDVEGYRALFPNASELLSAKDKEELTRLVMQPMKPVQRTFVNEPSLEMSKEYYIKTSSYPLIPELIKGTPLEALLADMRKNDVNRVAFVSGVKQGVAASKNLFIEDKEGNEVYNSNFLNNNRNVLDRDGFRIQLEVPYKQDKNHIREGTQQSKMLFVDIPFDTELIYRDEKTTAEDLQDKFIQYHKDIIRLHRDELLSEITDATGAVNIKRLGRILQEEGIDRGYSINSLLGLDVNDKNQFVIPLTFLPNAGQIEPVITSIISSRITRLKMPGKSYVQGSEFVLRTGRKGKVEEGTNLDQRGIVWTKPEYHGLNKLGYLHVDDDGKHHNSQIIMPFYFIKDGKKLLVQDYVKTVEHEGRTITVLDTDRIDPELLQINGFRIPYQGHNSGMWFEIVGFLPEAAGDLVLVPGEIAGQMGSDYDVDKLYSYMYNYAHREEFEREGIDTNDWNRLKRQIINKLVKLGAEKNDKGLYSKEDYDRAKEAVIEENIPHWESLGWKGKVPTHTVVKSKSKYEISKIHEDDPQSEEALQNAIIDIQKAVYTSTNDAIIKAILDPLSFKDVEEAIERLGSEGTSSFLGAFDPIYQRDSYFSNSTGKMATAVCANANTSHAMAQVSNLFIKGDGVVFLDENGQIYNDRILEDTAHLNRVNAFNEELYDFEVKEGEATLKLNRNQIVKPSAWRLDKVFTFPDPETGVVYRISNLISQLLGVSVDNAKEQKLGAFGINAENLNVVLTLVRTGFPFSIAKAFINQPILKEYYQAVGDANDIFDDQKIAGKKAKLIDDVYKKYSDMAGLSGPQFENFLKEPVEAQSYSQLKGMLGSSDEKYALDQLNVLKAYLYYKDISDAIATLTGTFGIDVKGLPKNMSEVYEKKQRIDAILTDSPVLGNVENYSKKTIPGLFMRIPALAVSLFMNSNMPLFAYSTMAYRAAKDSVLLMSGRSDLNTEQMDKFHNGIKQYIYSGFLFDDLESPASAKKRLLFDNNNNYSLQTRLASLQVKYPKNELIQSIQAVNSIDPKDPKLIAIESSYESDYTRKIQEHWEALLSSQEQDLRSFAVDMLKYALYVQPQEYGISSIMKYVPLQPLINMGFSEYLNHVNMSVDNFSDLSSLVENYRPNVIEAVKNFGMGDKLLRNFAEQFIAHNPDLVIVAREQNFLNKPSKEDWTTRIERINLPDGDVITKTKLVSLNKFTLPSPTSLETDKHLSLLRDGEYPKFLRFYTKEVGSQLYQGFFNVSDGTYIFYRIPKLGQTNVSEYEFNSNPETVVNSNVISDVPLPSPIALNVISNYQLDYKPKEDYIENKSVTNLLSGLVMDLNDVLSNSNLDKEQVNQAHYFQYLANTLAGYLNDVVIVLDNGMVNIGGKTTSDGKVVTFSPSYFKKLVKGDLKGRSGMTGKLEKARVVLHEMLHAAMFQAAAGNQGKEEFEKIKDVFKAYKKAISSNDTIRGVNVSILDAELFTLLNEIRDPRKDPGTVDFIKQVVADDARLKEVLGLLSNRLTKMAEKGEIVDKNYDLVSNEERYKEFAKYVKNTFSKNLNEIINKYYAYSDFNEFVTEALTNPKVQNSLRGIPALWESLVKSIKDLLAKIFGIESNERTLFDDAVDSVFNFLDASKGSEDKFRYEDSELNITGRVAIPQNKVSGVESYGSIVTANDDVLKALGPNPHSIDMILAGFRTRTTRSEKEVAKYDVKVGDIVKQFGKSSDGSIKEVLTRVTAIHPKGTPGWESTWYKEGWRQGDINAIDRFKNGAAAIEFELLNNSKSKATYKYYGADYTIVLDSNGIGIDVEGYKDKNENKQKLLNAFNNKLETQGSNNFSTKQPTNSDQRSLSKESLLNEDQKIAVTKAMKVIDAAPKENIFDDMFFLSGKGGTGKTFTTEVLIEKIKQKDPSAVISHVAPTWNAVNEIMLSLENPKIIPVTMASFLGIKPSSPDENGVQKFVIKHVPENSLSKPAVFSADYIILDEASMIGGDGKEPVLINPETKDYLSSDAWEAFKFRLDERFAATGTSPKKIILVGDYAQIPPVGTKKEQDAYIIEQMLDRPEQFSVLTKNMRTNIDALNALQEKYRANIDHARAEYKKGISSERSIPRNPIPLSERVNSQDGSLKWESNLETTLDRFVEIYKQNPTNVRNVVFINYNRIDNKNTISMVNKIRERLFGADAKNEYNKGDLVLLNGRLTIGSEEYQNETRFYVEDVVEDDATFKVKTLEFKGKRLKVSTNVGKTKVEHVVFVPNKGEVERVLGKYNFPKKGYDAIGGFIKYNLWLIIESLMANFSYGYVVNSHKVQGSSYEHVFVDEQNILNSPDTNKAVNNMLYTAVSRPKKTLTVFNALNPSNNSNKTVRTFGSQKNVVNLPGSSRQMIIKGSIFDTNMIPVIPTNLGGVHGAGVAQEAKNRGLVIAGEGAFSAKKDRVVFPVKNVWHEKTDMALYKQSAVNLVMLAKKYPNLQFAMPLAGLGHGEGNIDEIVPLLAKIVKAVPNVTIVIADDNVNLGRPGTVRQDKSRENMPEILEAFRKEGVTLSDDVAQDIVDNEIISDLIERGLLKTKCK